MYRRVLLLVFILGSSIFLTGCFKGKIEINDTIVAVGSGMDIKGQDMIFSVQVALPESKNGSSNQEPFMVLSAPGKSFSESGRNLYLSSPRRPLWSLINTNIIGEDLARQDIALFTDFATRNRNIRLNANIFLAYQATAEEVLKVKVPLEKHSASALNRVIELQENQLGIYMPVKTKEFLYKAGTPGIEPVLPQIIIEKKEGQESIKLEGTAVFKDRRLVGSLNEEESRGFRFLSSEPISGGLFLVPSPVEGRPVTLELSESICQSKAELGGSKIKILINIEAEGNFYEQNDEIDYLAIENIDKVEAAANDYIKSVVESCIYKAQELNSDIFGWGLNISQNNSAEWEKLQTDWSNIFSEVETEVNVDFILRRGYLVERVFKYNN